MSLDFVSVPRPDIDGGEHATWGGIQDDWQQNADLFDLSVEDARDIYRTHGRPNIDKFRREECYEALVELHERTSDEAMYAGQRPGDSEEEEDHESE